jgi:SAM-dependent methyltransferase
MNHVVGQEAAAAVIHTLPRALSQCDLMDFDTWDEGISYLCWHMIDRYHRIQHVLDLLVARGHLPIRRRPVSLLEVGSGPAPATFAVADYYAALDLWCQQTQQPYTLGPDIDPRTLDRGAIWSQLIHHLSESTLQNAPQSSAHRVFGTDYADLRGYSPWQVHHSARESQARALQSDWDADDVWMDLAAARREVALLGGGPPSGFDLIVIANFLTNKEMAESFAREIEELATSLTPGGILIFLGGTGKAYPAIWDRVARGRRVATLKRVLDLEEEAHSESVAHQRVADAILGSIGYLRDLAPDEYARIADRLPPDVVAGDPAALAFPRYRIMAFKREGNRVISRREAERIRTRRRRAGDGEAQVQ